MNQHNGIYWTDGQAILKIATAIVNEVDGIASRNGINGTFGDTEAAGDTGFNDLIGHATIGKSTTTG
jgi:hypothetical protein